MEQRWFENIREGMNVCDRDGDKIGTVGHIYRRPTTGTGMGTTGVSGTGTFPGGTTSGNYPGSSTGGTYSGSASGGTFSSGTEGWGHLKVDTGFLGLGKDLYIPFDAIRDVTSDCVFLNVDKDDLNRTNWDVRPEYISGREGM